MIESLFDGEIEDILDTNTEYILDTMIEDVKTLRYRNEFFSSNRKIEDLLYRKDLYEIER